MLFQAWLIFSLSTWQCESNCLSCDCSCLFWRPLDPCCYSEGASSTPSGQHLRVHTGASKQHPIHVQNRSKGNSGTGWSASISKCEEIWASSGKAALKCLAQLAPTEMCGITVLPRTSPTSQAAWLFHCQDVEELEDSGSSAPCITFSKGTRSHGLGKSLWTRISDKAPLTLTWNFHELSAPLWILSSSNLYKEKCFHSHVSQMKSIYWK